MAFHSSSGNLVQTLHTHKGARYVTTSTSFTDISGLNRCITPKFANSRIIVTVTMGACGTNDQFDNGQIMRIVRNVAGGGYNIFSEGVGNSDGSRQRVTMKGTGNAYNHDHMGGGLSMQVVDDPSYSVGQQLCYKVQVACQDSSRSFVLNGNGVNINNSAVHQARSCSTIVVQEIAQ